MIKSMISPQKVYENPEKFGGILKVGKKNGHPEYPINVFELMIKIFPDFPKKLAASMEGYIVMTKDNKPAILFGDKVVELIEIPDEIFKEIEKYLS
jgi:hypothetical protein